MSEDTPIAWTALDKGTRVLAADGEEIGKVTAVVADEQKDIFSGISFSSGLLDSDHFVPAELVDSITEESVVLTISAEQANELES